MGGEGESQLGMWFLGLCHHQFPGPVVLWGTGHCLRRAGLGTPRTATQVHLAPAILTLHEGEHPAWRGSYQLWHRFLCILRCLLFLVCRKGSPGSMGLYPVVDGAQQGFLFLLSCSLLSDRELLHIPTSSLLLRKKKKETY